MLIFVLLIVAFIVASCIVTHNKSEQTKDEPHAVSEEVEASPDTEQDDILSTIQQYKLYLFAGAFENTPVDQDIAMCQNVIDSLDAVIKSSHAENVKEMYREQAAVYKSFVSASIDTYANKELAFKVIEACDEVMANPSYENCAFLDDAYALLHPGNHIEHTDNTEQETIHVRLYNRLDMAERILNARKH